ncbi:hypothetical protein HY572_06545 [Candidatus Micrarchaeota archaeon]|nr:hypothetical protein [Candidatus Micrarchaeota archaeon]
MNFVCDSSTLISLGETCTLGALTFLKEKTGARFLVPPAVVFESMQHPEQIKRYAFSGYKIQHQLEAGVLEATPPTKNLEQNAREILGQANRVFSVNKKPLKVLQIGEAECLAAYNAEAAKGVLVDEKTTRLFIEDPTLLKESLSAEYHRPVEVNRDAWEAVRKFTGGMVAVRSTEILAMAYEYGFFDGYQQNAANAFHSALYALRNAGCSITSHELLEYQRVQKT